MSTTYPSSVDTYSTHVNGETIDASAINNLQDAVVAVETAVGTAPAGGYSNLSARVAAAALQSADYVIYRSGANTLAVNGSTGATDYTNTDPAAVLQSVINVLGAGGGTVVFKAGNYAWNSVPALKPNTTGWLRIVGEPGATITLSTSGSRFLDFGKVADNDTFRYIKIEGFTVDAAALSALNQVQHIVIGTYAGGSGTVSGQDVNFDHIVVQDIRTLNVRTHATYLHLNVWIALHATNNTTQYTLSNILVQRCEFNGGAYGVGIYGQRQSGFLASADANIWEDKIYVRDIYHDTGITPSGSGSFAHVHVGSGALGGTCWIERIHGLNSWDVGVEVDNFETAFVTDVRLENYNGFGIAITNYATLSNPKAQTYYLTNIVGHWNTGTWSSDASSLIGAVQSNNGAGTPQPFGRIVARNIKVFRNGSSLDGSGIEGDLALIKIPMIEFLLDGAQYQAVGLTHTTGGPSPTVIFANPTSQTRFTVRNCDIRLEGTFGVGSSAIGFAALNLNGNLDLLLENIRVDVQFTNIASFSLHGLDLGTGSGSTVTGTIRGFKWITNDTGGRGILVADTGTLTVNNRLRIENCDFSGMAAGGSEILYLDTANKAKTFVQNNVWKTYPKAAYTITAPTSNTGTRYTDTWEGTFSITGGAVTKVEISRDNSTYLQVAAGTNVSFAMQHGDYYRITYTVAPTITVIPTN